MAITRAKQARQMYKRGTFGGNKGPQGPAGGASAGGNYGGNINPSQDYGGGSGDRDDIREQYSVASTTGTSPQSIRAPVDKTGPGTAQQRVINLLDEFKKKRPKLKGTFGILDILTGGKFKQKFTDFLASKNRPFFEDVIRAGKIPGLNFATVANMTPEELEEAYRNYDRARLSGEIDAFGNPLNQGDDGPPPLFPLTGIMTQTPEEDEEPEYVNPLSKLTARIAGTQFAADGGRIGFFKGAQADTAKGKAMSPGTTASGGLRNSPGSTGEGGAVTRDRAKLPVEPTSTKGLAQHNINNQKLKNAVRLGLITNDEYNILGGYDVNQTMGLNPFLTGVSSGLYNVYQTIKGDQPASEIFGDVKRNMIGSFGLPENLQTKYDNIMAMSSQEMTDQLADQKIAQMAGGGIASLEDMDREGFLLGGIAKGLKKAVRGIKKLAKSPIGKAALAYAAFTYGPGLLKGKTLPPSMGFKSKGLFDIIRANPMKSIFAASAAAGAMTPKEDKNKFDLDSYYASGKLDPSLSTRMMGSDFDFYGGRIASADGGSTDKEPVAKKTMPLLDMGGKEMDLREEGGFVPIGRMEKADDVPARLSKNEFVFTADAVRNAGDGDVDKGAEVMYNMMKNLEAGGEVSEESQGLEGARKMFQTSQRLEEVL